MVTTGSSAVCPRCGEGKPLVAFARDRRRKGGRDSWCKECRAAQARLRRHRRRTTAEATEDATALVVRERAANSGATGANSRAVPVPDGDLAWPQPLDPAEYPAALVERRELVIAIYERLDAEVGRRRGGGG